MRDDGGREREGLGEIHGGGEGLFARGAIDRHAEDDRAHAEEGLGEVEGRAPGEGHEEGRVARERLDARLDGARGAVACEAANREQRLLLGWRGIDADITRERAHDAASQEAEQGWVTRRGGAEEEGHSDLFFSACILSSNAMLVTTPTTPTPMATLPPSEIPSA